VLLARVTQLKSKGEVRYVGVSTGMKVTVCDRDIFQIAQSHIDLGAPFDASDSAFDEPMAKSLGHRHAFAGRAENENAVHAAGEQKINEALDGGFVQCAGFRNRSDHGDDEAVMF